MPIFLNPLPQRVRVTREDFVIPERPLVRVDPAPEEELADVREIVSALLPGAQLSGERDVEAPVYLGLVAAGALGAGAAEESIPQAYTLDVSPAAVLLNASSPMGWRYGLLTLAQLSGESAIAGAQIQDWPAFAVRGVRIPRPAASFQPGFRERLLVNLSHWRWNAVAFTEDDPAWRPSSRLVRVVPAAQAPPASARLLEAPGLYPDFREDGARIVQEAHAAWIRGDAAWWLDLGALPEELLIDILWDGLGFAGSCAWNPARAEIKAHRRAFAPFFFGTAAEALPRALRALEAAEEALSGSEHGLSRALDADDPFTPVRVATTLRLEERAREAAQEAERAIEEFDEAAVAVAVNAGAIQALRNAAQALGELGQRLEGLQRAREQYAAAHVASSNARATSRRTLSAAEQLDALATAMRKRREEFARVWKHERTGPIPHAAGTALDERAASLAARAAELRALRDRYIQTGNLRPPAAAGMALPLPPADRALSPERRGLRSLPDWWLEGGAARMRVEVERDGHGLPWEVLIDFRAHAGEAGAFNVRGARMAALDPEENVARPIPVQLTRRGFVFAPLAGVQAYHLYLYSEPVSDRTERLVRARQSREATRIDGAHYTARLTPAGELVAWRPEGLAAEIDGPSAGEPILEFADHPLSAGTRVRVLETGPLLARVQAETPEGFAVRYDFYGALPGCEISLNIPVRAITTRWGQAEWEAAPDDVAAADRTWAAITRPDGVAAAVLTPGHTALFTAGAGSLTADSPVGLRYLGLAVGRFTDAGREVAALAAALAAPPRILIGSIEERRVIQF